MLFSIPTPISQPIIEIKKSNEFTLAFENKQYVSKIILSDGIKIDLSEKNNISPIIYSISLTLKDLWHYNKIFKIYETIDESYNIIEKLFLKEKVSIRKTNDNFSLILKINLPFGDEDEIIIPLTKKHAEKSQTNDRLINEINQLKTRIKVLEEENTSFKNIIKNLESRILTLENKNSVLEIPSVNKISKIMEKNEIILDSKIINKNEEIDFVINRLKQNLNYKVLKFNLLYRASRDGDAISIFHSKCDYKTKVLVLYYTIKEVRFGGYTEIGFDSSKTYKNDMNSFLFSINNRKIYNAKGEEQIVCFDDSGPSFGHCDVAIYLYDDIPILSKQNKTHLTNFDITSFEGLNSCEINNGEKYFNLKELEVFQIVLN